LTVGTGRGVWTLSGFEQGPQVLAFELVEPQRGLDRDQHRLGDVAHPALLELRVVVDADSGQDRDLLPP
jgi:hypothetical protein